MPELQEWRKKTETQGLVLFGIAMAFHFIVTDFGLLAHYREAHKNKRRWMIAGGVIMNILKEELPEE